MWVKKITVYFLSLLTLISCNADNNDLIGPQSALGAKGFYPFGKYELISFEEDRAPSFAARLDILNEKDNENHYILNGRAAVNFFFAKFDCNFNKKTIKIYGIGSTEIAGSRAETNFERDFLARLSRVERYEFNHDGSKLTLHLPKEEKRMMVFRVIND